MTLVQGNSGLARLVDLCQAVAEGSFRCSSICIHRTTTDGAYLTTTIETAADDTAVHLDVRDVDIAVSHITATEDVTTHIEQVVARLGIVKFLDIATVLIAVADLSVVDSHVSRAEDTAALTATVDITVDGGNTIVEVGAVEVANDDMRLTEDIRCVVRDSTDLTGMITHATTPAATIDVTYHAALDIGVGTGLKVVFVSHVKEIIHTAGRTCCIDILLDRTTKQGNVRRTIDIAAQSIRSTTIATTISIVHHGGTLIDDDIGVVSFISTFLLSISQTAKVSVIHLGRPYQLMGVGKVHICVAGILGVVALAFIVVAKGPSGLPVCLPLIFPFVLQVTVSDFTSPSLLLFPIRIILRYLS